MTDLSDQFIALWKEQWEKALKDPLLQKLGHEMMSQFQDMNQDAKRMYESVLREPRKTEGQPQTFGDDAHDFAVSRLDFENRLKELEDRVRKLESLCRDRSSFG